MFNVILSPRPGINFAKNMLFIESKKQIPRAAPSE